MAYKLGSDGKVYNAETNRRVYPVVMQAKRFLGGKAGAAKFREYLLAKNPATEKAQEKREPALELLMEKGSELDYSAEQIAKMLTGSDVLFCIADRRRVLMKQKIARNDATLQIYEQYLPRVVELMAYAKELDKYTLRDYVFLFDGESANDFLLIQVRQNLEYHGGNGVHYMNRESTNSTWALLDGVIDLAVIAKELNQEKAGKLQQKIVAALESYPALKKYVENAFKTDHNKDAIIGVQTGEEYLISEVNAQSHAIIDGLKKRGLLVKEQLSPGF